MSKEVYSTEKILITFQLTLSHLVESNGKKRFLLNKAITNFLLFRRVNWEYDEITGKVYALFAKNGKFSLKEVDRSNGGLVFSLNIPAFLFVDEIKVNDGLVYFLYRHDKTDGYKKLFRMRIDS